MFITATITKRDHLLTDLRFLKRSIETMIAIEPDEDLVLLLDTLKTHELLLTAKWLVHNDSGQLVLIGSFGDVEC